MPAGLQMPASFQVIDDLLGEADRFGHARAAAGQRPSDGLTYAHAVPGRNKERVHALARPHDRAHAAALEQKRRPIAAQAPRLVVLADEARLRAAHTGEIKEHAHMRGQAEAPRMSDALPVEEDQVGLLREALEGAQEERPFAEGQVAGHVREARSPGYRHRLHHGAVDGRPEDDGGPCPRSVAQIGQVGPGHEPDPLGTAASQHAGAQPGLESLRTSDSGRHSGYGTSSRAISTWPENRARASSRRVSSSPWRPASMWARMSRVTPARAAVSPAWAAVEWTPAPRVRPSENVASWMSVWAPRASASTAAQGSVSEE